MLYIFFVDVFDILCQLPSGYLKSHRACQVIRIIHWTSQKFRNIYQACNNPRNIHRACKKSRRLHPAILIVKYVAWILYRNNSVEVIIRTSAVFTKHFVKIYLRCVTETRCSIQQNFSWQFVCVFLFSTNNRRYPLMVSMVAECYNKGS